MLASDCGPPDLARQWCLDHARLYLGAGPLTGVLARNALEPLVNLARLRIRAGDPDGGYQYLDDLYHAVNTGTDIVIDGIHVQPQRLTGNEQDRQELRRWLWSVHLADGTRALTSAGRWPDAHQHLRRHHGIGHRTLDARQVAVIAHATTGRHNTAAELIAKTTPGDPWEHIVTTSLGLLCRPPSKNLASPTPQA